MSQESTIQHFLSYPVIPVFYNADAEVSKQVLDACYRGGVRVFEFTNRGKNALDVYKQVFAKGNLTVDLVHGAGIVFTSAEAEAFIEAGAKFIVSPCYVESVADACYQNKIPYMPGCMTIKEIHHAMQAGCEIIKVFPGEVLGTSFVKAVKAVLPQAKLMVTGGVSPIKENIRSWFTAGVSAVGMGSQLFKKEWLDNGEYQHIEDACKDAFSYIS